MEDKNSEQTALVLKTDTAALVPTADGEKIGYWGKNARRLNVLSRVLLLVLAVFLTVFTALNYAAFSPLNLYYFGQDLLNLQAQVGGEAKTLYYTYGGEGASVAAYRGGAAVAGCKGISIYASDGALLLTLAYEQPMTAPRTAVSRDYLIVYDLGSTAFLVFNAHDLLYEGESGAPILGVGLSDAGCFSLIVASDTALSAVELYDASFRHPYTLNRASATVAAPLAGDGRTLALVGATAVGAQVDFITFGETESRASVTFEGFPLAAEFTANGVLAVLTTKGLYTVTTMGKTLGTLDFAGAVPTAYDIGEHGAAVALLDDAVTGASRVVTVSRRGKERGTVTLQSEVSAVALGRTYCYVLSFDTATAFSRKNGMVKAALFVPTGYLGITATEGDTARILYPAMALPLTAK